MSSDTPVPEAQATTDLPLVVNELNDEVPVGEFVGQCKWFNDKLGYGFITIQAGKDKGKDIFVHHSGIKPLNSNYKTLKKGEYVNFNIITGDNGLQAVDVTGINGGSLMCDVLPATKLVPPIASTPTITKGFTPVTYKRNNIQRRSSPNRRGGFRGGQRNNTPERT